MFPGPGCSAITDEQEVISYLTVYHSLALQAPTSGSGERWHFVVVTDPLQREALAALYRKGARSVGMEKKEDQARAVAANEKEATTFVRSLDSARYLVEHLHEVPVHVIPYWNRW
jgi:nitroreductase